MHAKRFVCRDFDIDGEKGTIHTKNHLKVCKAKAPSRYAPDRH